MKVSRSNHIRNLVVYLYTNKKESVESISSRLELPQRTVYRWLGGKEEIIRKNKEDLYKHLLINIIKYNKVWVKETNQGWLNDQKKEENK